MIYEGKEILQPSLTNNPIVVSRVLFSKVISLDWNINAPTQYLLQIHTHVKWVFMLSSFDETADVLL